MEQGRDCYRVDEESKEDREVDVDVGVGAVTPARSDS